MKLYDDVMEIALAATCGFLVGLSAGILVVAVLFLWGLP